MNKIFRVLCYVITGIISMPGLGCSMDDKADSIASKSAKDDVVIVSSAVVNRSGLELDTRQNGTPIDGVVLTIPADAVEKEDSVDIGYTTKYVKIKKGRWSGITIVISMENTSSFKKPVKISIPYDASKNPDLVIPFQVDERGKLHVMDIADIDRENRMLNIMTWKPCAFTWVYP